MNDSVTDHTQPTNSKRNRILVLSILAVLALWAALSFARTTANTFNNRTASVDLHFYWWSGIMVRQGHNPYTANRNDQLADTPIYFLDAGFVNSPPEDVIAFKAGHPPGIPGILPSGLLLIQPFAFLSWPTARFGWWLTNVALLLIIPWLSFRLLPVGETIPRSHKLAIYLIFLSMMATRVAVSNGQTTLFVFACILGCLLLTQDRPIWAGILLGLAMTKPTLTMPLVLLLLFTWRWRVLLIGVAVQLISFLILDRLLSDRLIEMVMSVLISADNYVNQEGIHLWEFLRLSYPASAFASLLFTISILGLILYRIRTRRTLLPEKTDLSILNLHLFSALSFYSLLVVYHREYDAVLYIVFAVLLLYGLRTHLWEMSKKRYWAVGILFVILTATLMRPGVFILSFVPASLVPVAEWMMSRATASIALLTALALAIWLLYRPLPSVYVERMRVKSPGVD
ncbi:MAG: DUF2029 domain-containing protein [Caldilineales bacterium]|nr:DUF2029 domain-containing protein [Caldilineales bacterium]